MEDKKEKILSMVCGETDVKARRRINTAIDTIANITAQEIEAGISIERLASINVPVYRYHGQITIHGQLPDIDSGYCFGYKSLFKNANGSIGVKYIAIDAEKKDILSKIQRIGKSICHYSKDSQGVELTKVFNPDEKEKCIEYYNSIPSQYFIGRKEVFHSCLSGRYYAIIGFMASPIEVFWKFVTWYSNGEINNQDEFNTSYNAKMERERIESEQRTKELNERIAREKQELEIKRANRLEAFKNIKGIENFKPIEGVFYFLYNNGAMKKIEFKKDRWTDKLVFTKGFTEYKITGNKFNDLFLDIKAIYSGETINTIKEGNN